MWIVKKRAHYDRSKPRYPSELTNEEWVLVKLWVPHAKRGGNKRTVDVREVINGLMYVLGTGAIGRRCRRTCRRSTANHAFYRWQHDGTLDRLHQALYLLCREEVGRDANPSAAIVDSQKRRGRREEGRALTRPALTQEAPRPCRHARLTDARRCSCGQYPGQGWRRAGDGDGVRSLPVLLKLYADGGYAGPQFQAGLRRVMRQVNVEIVKCSDAAKGFAVLPKRWIVERTIAWLNRCRRLNKN